MVIKPPKNPKLQTPNPNPTPPKTPPSISLPNILHPQPHADKFSINIKQIIKKQSRILKIINEEYEIKHESKYK